MIAAVPMMGIATAEAANKKGDRDDARVYHNYNKSKRGNKTVVKSTHTTKSNRYVVTTTKSTVKTKNGITKRTVVVRRDHGPKLIDKWKNHANKYYKRTGNYLYGFYNGKSWKHGKKAKKYNFKCVAAAKMRHGNGKRIWGIGGEKRGPGACDRAMNECRTELRIRKSTGRNPNAKCVVVKRG